MKSEQIALIAAHKLLLELFAPRVPIGGGSKTGQQLYKLWLNSARMKPCPACAKRDKELFEWLERRRAYEAAAQKNRNDYPEASWPAFEDLPGNDMPSVSKGDCRRCGGTGAVEGRPRPKPVEANPTGSSISGVFPNTHFPTEGVQASIIMRRLAAHDTLSCDVLTAYHGPPGDYAEVEVGDRLLPVVTLTDAYRQHIAPVLVLRPTKKRKQKSTGPVAISWRCRIVSVPEGQAPSVQQQRLIDERVKSVLALKERMPAPFEPHEDRSHGKLIEENQERNYLSEGEALLFALRSWRASTDPERAMVWGWAYDAAKGLLASAYNAWQQECWRIGQE